MESAHPNRSLWPGARLLVAVCVALTVAGCSKKTPAPEPYGGASVIDEERDIVNEVVPDSARRADILAILDQAEARMRRFDDEVSPLGDSLRTLFRSRDATDEQLTAVYQAISELRGQALRDFTRYQIDIRNITFPNEWEEIAGRDNRLISN